MQQQNTQAIFKLALLKLPEFIINVVRKFDQQGKKTIPADKFANASLVISLLPPEYIVDEFVKNSFLPNEDPFWDYVAQRSEVSILKGLCKIFPSVIDYESVSGIFNDRDSVGNLIITDQVKKEFFSKIESLIKLAIRYVHEKRGPYSVKNNKAIKKFYENEYLEQLDVTKYSKIFEIGNLNFPLYEA